MTVATKRRTRAAAATAPGPDMSHAPCALVLQGGGALGAYQAGAYSAMAEADVLPKWVAGVSIGAINSALIAGNAPEKRVDRLREFWELVSSQPAQQLPNWWGSRIFQNQISAQAAMFTGIPGFFKPRQDLALLLGNNAPVLSYYDTSPLKDTLERLVDFKRLNAERDQLRFMVGAVDVCSGESRYFSNSDPKHPITAAHVMASGALPPGFAPVMVEGRHYWDGGVVSNTPLTEVLSRRDRSEPWVVYQVDLFNARGPLPTTISGVTERQKDIMYASRTDLNTQLATQTQPLMEALARLLDRLPANLQKDEDALLLRKRLEEAPVQIRQLIYRDRASDLDSKDYEFSRASMIEHWDAGHADMRRTISHAKHLAKPPPVGVTECEPATAHVAAD